MKNDTTTTFLNFVLAALVVLGVVMAYFNMRDTRILRQLNFEAMRDNAALSRIQAMAIDTANYNAQAKSPELARILEAVEGKPVAH